MDLVFRNVRIKDDAPLTDVAIADGVIIAIQPNLPGVGVKEVAGEGRVLIPGLVECHLHLEKAMIKDRKANRSGTLKMSLRFSILTFRISAP